MNGRRATALLLSMLVLASTGFAPVPKSATATDATPNGSAPTKLEASPASQPTTAATTAPSSPALRFTLKDLKGGDIDLMQYHGRVLLVVPVAWDSNRRQFEDIQRVSQFAGDRGVAVLAVLTADFNKETRPDVEVVKAIAARYNTTFAFAATTSVSGEKIHPLFKYLAATEGGDIKGAFTKFLISRDGEVAHRWPPEARILEGNNVEPIDEAINATMSK